MRYVLLFGSASEDVGFDWQGPDARRIEEEVNAWFAELAAKGIVQGGERLAGATSSTTFRGTGLSQQTIDGPFIESKEEVSGFGIIEVPDLDAALAIARTWPALQVPGESVEVRPVWEM
jgi:hypothetical protein